MKRHNEGYSDGGGESALVPGGFNAPDALGRDAYPAVRGSYPSYYAETDTAESLQLRTTIQDYLRILIKRRWVIVGVVSGACALAFFISMVMTPLYTATARVQIDRQIAKVVEGADVSPTEDTSVDFLQTQYELLRSRSLAQRVVAKLNLVEEPKDGGSGLSLSSLFGWLSPQEAAPEESRLSDKERDAIDAILRRTTISPVKNSRLVDIHYVSADPVKAQRVANAIAEGFLASNLDRRIDASSYAKTFLEDQLQQLKLKLEDSERTMLQFAQDQRIITIGDSALVDTSLGVTNTSLSTITAERVKNETAWKQAQSTDGLGLSQVLASKVIQTLREQRASLLSEYQEKLNTFKPNYPAMVQLQNRIGELNRQIDIEVQAIKDSIRAAYEASLAQEQIVAGQVDTLKRESLDTQKRSIQYNILKREVDTNRSIYEGLLQRYKEIGVAGGVGTNNISIVDKADLPTGPSSPRTLLNLLIAFVLGLVGGVGGALLMEFLDDSVKSPEDVEHATNLVTVGIIPETPALGMAQALASPRSAVSEAYRSLCTSLQFSTSTGIPKSLAITSPRPSEGKSTTAFAIARHFAATNSRVLLIDCDLRNPSLHRVVGTDDSFGLTNYLTGGCSLWDSCAETQHPNLTFIAAGPLPPNPAELLSGPKLHSLLAEASESFDLVILDCPPVMGIADAPLVANATAGTVLVTMAGETRAAAVRSAIKRLQFARASLLGCVLTKFDPRNVGFGYGYGEEYGYGYGYGANEYSYGANNQSPKLPVAKAS
ncbi:MAG: GumC family protein [Parvibaculaceae bacterium]